MKKLISILVAMAMMLSLTVISAFAALDPNQQPDGANAKLFKYLEVAESVTAPTIEFSFHFEPVSNTANTTTPTIQDVTITPATRTTADNDYNSVYGAKTFNEIFPAGTFTAAGVYTYTVTENALNRTDVAQGGETYTVNIYVDATKTIKNVTATKLGEDGKQVIQVNEPVVDEGQTVKVQGLTFDNKYTKTEEIETPIPSEDLYGVLNIAKHVANKSGAADTSARANDQFKFILTLTKAYGAPDAVPAAKVHTATGEQDYTGTLAYGTNEIVLKDGEVFYFPTLPAGTKWTVKEDLPNSNNDKKAQYQAAYVVTTSDTTAGLVKSGDAAAGAELPAGSTYLLKSDTAGEKAVYTNTYDDKLDQPEGILISNLPYIALALVAIGGLVAYVIVRRKADDEA